MSTNWEFFRRQIDGKPASILVNIGIADELPKMTFNKLIKIFIRLNNSNQDGLTTRDEANALDKIEDEINDKINENTTISVGRITHEQSREYFYYLSNLDDVDLIYSIFIENNYECRKMVSIDEDWDEYGQRLFPSDREWQEIQDRNVVESLKGHGDLLKDKREVDHYSYFKCKSDATGFINEIQKMGFTVKNLEQTDDNFVVHATRFECPSFPEITKSTLPLFDLSGKWNGDYDGWGCSVVKT